MTASSLTWLSTTFANGHDLIRLDAAAIGELASKARGITIVSAYWDKRFFTSLFKAIPPERLGKTTVRAYVNGFSGQRGAEEAKALCRLARQWPDLQELSLAVVPGWRLFHSKLIVFQRTRGVVLLIGSANATESAYTENEELMLMVRAPALPAGLRTYLDTLQRDAKPANEVSEFEAHTLRSFFRGGDIYYRPSIVTAFRFDMRLPSDLRRKMTTLAREVPAGFSARAGGSYDPFAKVGLSANDERAASELSVPEERIVGASRVPVRSYGVQTCYGCWVPTPYREDLEKKLVPVRARRLALLTRLAQKLADADLLRERASERFGQLEAFAEARGTPLTEISSERLRRFDKFLERARHRLDDDGWRKRASSPYVQAAVPEIWNDPTSAREFIDSFFADLEVVAIGHKKPRIWKALVQKVPALTGTPSAEDTESALSKHLRRTGWRGADWTASSSAES